MSKAAPELGWVNVKDRLPPTPFKHQEWDADKKKARKLSNSSIYCVSWWNKKKRRYVATQGVFTRGWCSGWHRVESLEIIHPDYWLAIPPPPLAPIEKTEELDIAARGGQA